MSKELQEIEDLAEDLGYKPGTPDFERATRALKVERCRDMRGVTSCEVCSLQEHCEILKQHLIDIRYVRKRP